TARPSIARLAAMLASVSTVASGRVKPAVYFRPTAHPISSSPARIRTSQAITDLLGPMGQGRPYRCVAKERGRPRARTIRHPGRGRSSSLMKVQELFQAPARLEGSRGRNQYARDLDFSSASGLAKSVLSRATEQMARLRSKLLNYWSEWQDLN